MTGPLGVPNLDVARYVLAHSKVNFGTPSPVQLGGNPNHPSLLNRLIDILSRPNYAIANTFHAAAQQHNPLAAFFRGLEGKDKTTFSTVLGQDLGVTNPVVKGLGGFIGDIALDPTTYIGAGAIKDVLKIGAEKAGVLNKFAKAAETLPAKPVVTDLALLHSPEDLQSAAARVRIGDFFGGVTQAKQTAIPVAKAEKLTDLTKLFAGANKGKELAPSLATEGDKSLVKQVADVIPSIAPKVKPDPAALADAEKFTAEQFAQHVVTTSRPKAKINLKSPDTINPNQQALLWKHAVNSAAEVHPNAPAKQFDTAFKMLIHAENHLEASGKVLRYWDGSNLKLSDVIAELHTGKGVKFSNTVMPTLVKELSKSGNIRYTDPNIAQAIHNVRVRSAVLDSEPIKHAVDSVLKEKDALKQAPLSDVALSKLFKSLPGLAKGVAESGGASSLGADAAKTLAADTIKAAEVSVPQRAIDRVGKYIDTQLVTSDTRNATRINAPLTTAIKDQLGITTHDYQMPLSGKGEVESSFMGRIFSWYGQKDLRPLTEQQLLTATNSAWLRTAAIKRLSEGFTQEQQLRALRFAQGLEADGGQLGLQFRTALENLFRGTNLTGKAWSGQSVVERSGMLMERLNKHLQQNKLPYKFISGKVKNPITGEIIDYSKGLDWLDSWKSWDIKNPAEFFNKLFSAVEQSAHEKALFDEIGTRFGSIVAGGGYKIAISHPYLKGYFFTEDIARQIPYVMRDINTFFTTGANNPFLRTFDKISRAWKFTVTLPNPSHHIHNLLGDAYMSWMAGVRGARPYYYAGQILRTQGDLYQGLNDLEKLVAADAIPRAMGKTPNPKEILFRNASGHPFTAEQLYVAANKMGILPQAHIVEDIMGGDTSLTKLQPFGGHVRGKLEKFSEVREHFARIAHFVDVVKRSSGNDFESIFRKAGYEVRKWHPDYLTLTPFEKKFMRRLMPFYSWTRRAIPLMIESAVMSPGKTLTYPKFMQAMQTMAGVDNVDRGNPFPADQLFPQWIRDRGIGPISKMPILGARATPPGDTIVNPSNPLYDLFGQFSNPIQGIGSMLTPVIRIPTEILSGRQLYNQAPINKDNLSEYVGNQLPYWPLVQSFTGLTPTGGQTSRAQKSGAFNTERFINWLTSLGVRGTGPYIKEAQFEQKGGG